MIISSQDDKGWCDFNNYVNFSELNNDQETDPDYNKNYTYILHKHSTKK
jgi:hypothetical protein